MIKSVQFEDLQLQFDPSTIAIAKKLVGQGLTSTPLPMKPDQEDGMRTGMVQLTRDSSLMTHLRILLSEGQLGRLRDGIATRTALQALQCRQDETYADGDHWPDDQLRLSKNDCLTATLVVALNLSQARMCISQTPSRDSDSTAIPIPKHIQEVSTVMNVSVYVHLWGSHHQHIRFAIICLHLTFHY
jgi:hypothetical protein